MFGYNDVYNYNNQSDNAMPWHCIGLTLSYSFFG